jgi:hypothetical protein
MVVKYFCDRCGNETGEGELRIGRLSIPPDLDVTIDLCPRCEEDARTGFLGNAASTPPEGYAEKPSGAAELEGGRR